VYTKACYQSLLEIGGACSHLTHLLQDSAQHYPQPASDIPSAFICLVLRNPFKPEALVIYRNLTDYQLSAIRCSLLNVFTVSSAKNVIQSTVGLLLNSDIMEP
jgi:hypothetical protein